MRQIEVRVGERSYPVLMGPGVLARVGSGLSGWLGLRATRCFVVRDAGLPDQWLDRLVEGLRDEGFSIETWSQVPDEGRKNMSSVRDLLHQLGKARWERREPILALGGGITGDVGGFAAAIYRRGIPVVQCPTTLLAMVDASVGGKTGVNLEADDSGLRKNLVGAFHQPRAVVADTDVLGTLSERQYRSGLAECVKHGMIGATWGDPGLLDWMEASASGLLERQQGLLAELIARNVAVKAAAIEGDEREEAESGGRALLNLGHTFGHAIETLPGVWPGDDRGAGPLLHGEAVAAGLCAAATSAATLGMSDAALGDRVRRLLERLGLPTSIGGLPATEAILARMAHDKKVRGGRLRLVLPEGPGRARVVEGPPEDAVRAGIDAMRGD